MQRMEQWPVVLGICAAHLQMKTRQAKAKNCKTKGVETGLETIIQSGHLWMKVGYYSAVDWMKW